MPAGPQPAGADDEVYLTPRVRRLRHVVWGMLAAWLVLAVLAVVLVRVL
ncbi:MAG: hypothetical protein M1435_02480 [Actinobacteria bacterium]|nr:hypothetical protein [Actinomycetota bacterium]MDA8300574.1 hypothetical protein [Actinomycetota bacterium]